MREIYCSKKCPHLKIAEKAYCVHNSNGLIEKIELTKSSINYIDNEGIDHNFLAAIYLPQACLCNPVSIDKIIKEVVN